jgi:hypothetical protein
MKNSIFNSFIAAAAFSLAFGLSNHAAAEQNPEQAVAAGLSGQQVPFGTNRPLDSSKMDVLIVTGLTGAIEQQDLELNTQAQNRAEAEYQRYSASDSLTLPPGHVYQSVTVAF